MMLSSSAVDRVLVRQTRNHGETHRPETKKVAKVSVAGGTAGEKKRLAADPQVLTIPPRTSQGGETPPSPGRRTRCRKAGRPLTVRAPVPGGPVLRRVRPALAFIHPRVRGGDQGVSVNRALAVGDRGADAHADGDHGAGDLGRRGDDLLHAGAHVLDLGL